MDISAYLNKNILSLMIRDQWFLFEAGLRPVSYTHLSWRFLVVKNREALNSMVELQPYTGMMKTASCAIIVMGDREASQPDEYLYVDAVFIIPVSVSYTHLNHRRYFGCRFISQLPSVFPQLLTAISQYVSAIQQYFGGLSRCGANLCVD